MSRRAAIAFLCSLSWVAFSAAMLATATPAAALPGPGEALAIDPSWGDEIPFCAHARLPLRRDQRLGALLGEDNTHDDSDPRYLEYDLTHVDLRLRLDFDQQAIRGEVTYEIRSEVDQLTSVLLDLVDTMEIEDIEQDGAAASYRHAARQIVVTLVRSIARDESTSLHIRYHGVPQFDGFMGLQYAFHPQRPGPATPAAQTLSETNSAPAWWPCKDVTYDKFTCDLWIDAPSAYRATGNGTRIEEAIADPGRRVTHWREAYPIATYLVSVNATNFAHWVDHYTPLDGGAPMPIEYYAYPEDEATARAAWARTPRMISHFARLFGEYPFVDEKYGMVEFLWSGAMEHQTLTSYGAYLLPFDLHSNERVVAHELGHQWWGDQVSPRTWDDIWLNEGFASYCEALWYEEAEGDSAYHAHMLSRDLPPGREFPGAVYHPEYTFNSTVYSKGAWVLHMLRHVLSDDVFFAALRSYRRSYAYETATTDLFRRELERVSGRDLSAFFDSWVYGEGRPHYLLEWTATPLAEGVAVDLVLEQTQAEPTFTMPVDLVALFEDAPPETVTVTDSLRVQHTRIVFAREPERLLLDPEDWILKRVEYVAGPSSVASNAGSNRGWTIHGIEPNPASGPVRIVLEAPNDGAAWHGGAALHGGAAWHGGAASHSGAAAWNPARALRIVDAGGRMVKTLTPRYDGRRWLAIWDGKDRSGAYAPTGVYWLSGVEGTRGRSLLRIR